MIKQLSHIILVLLLGATQYAQAQGLTTRARSVEPGKRLVYELFDQLFTGIEVVDSSRLEVELEPVQVFGWHGSWLGDAYKSYDYRLLTTASYAYCELTLQNDQLQFDNNSWGGNEAAEFREMARARECNTTLSLRCTDTKAITRLFTQDSARTQCIDYLLEQISEAEGVDVNLYKIPFGYRDSLTQFLSELAIALHARDKYLVLGLPAIPDQRRYNLTVLDSIVDQFVMTGYNYFYDGSLTAGPSSPLAGGPYNLTSSVAGYVNKGISREKLFVALPYFGTSWKLNADSTYVRDTATKTFATLRYNQAMDSLGANTLEYDSIAQTGYHYFTTIVPTSDTTSDTIVSSILYIDDAKTLKAKIDWMLQEDLAGVGIWTMGYDTGYAELWQMLDDNYEVVKNPDFAPIPPEPEPLFTLDPNDPEAAAAEVEENLRAILEQRDVLMVLAVILLGCLGLGILVACFSQVVYSRIFIQDWVVYAKVAGGFVAFVLVCIGVSAYVFESDPLVVTRMEKPVILSGDVIDLLIRIGMIGFGLITLASWQVFLKINRDIP